MAIQPIYSTPERNGDIELIEKTDAELTQGDKKFSGKLEISQEWPTGELSWEFTESDSLDDANFGLVTIQCNSNNPFNLTGSVISKGEHLLRGSVDKPTVTGSDHKIESVIFHLAEYHRLKGERLPEKGPTGITLYNDEIFLKDDKWIVTLRFCDEPSNFMFRKDPRLSGVGEIKKADGGKFKKEKALPVLDALDAFLSFSFTAHTPPMLAVGGNSNFPKSCLFLKSHYIESNYFLMGWLDEAEGQHLSEAFPGFMKLWNQKEWQEPIRTSVDYLIEATKHSGGTKGAIAMAQIPLEMIASMIFTDSQEIIIEDEFGKLSAATKLQMVLHDCGIPATIPSGLPLLKEISTKGVSYDSGPKIITWVRNLVIHPTATNRKKLEDMLTKCGKSEFSGGSDVIADNNKIYYESLQLFRWYITLILLKLFDYQGEYGNRLVSKNVAIYEKVPWAK